jgi:hypothetical protein
VPLTAPSDLKVQIFTTAFRKIQELPFNNQAVGVDVSFKLTDRWGSPMASGLYYVVVTVNSSQRMVGKLMILR